VNGFASRGFSEGWSMMLVNGFASRSFSEGWSSMLSLTNL
jgi:hypothetical protein